MREPCHDIEAAFFLHVPGVTSLSIAILNSSKFVKKRVSGCEGVQRFFFPNDGGSFLTVGVPRELSGLS